MDRIEKIYDEFLLPFMEEFGIEDTISHRLWLLEIIQATWAETEVDVGEEFEKILYQAAVSGEIFNLQLKLMFPSLLMK